MTFPSRREAEERYGQRFSAPMVRGAVRDPLEDLRSLAWEPDAYGPWYDEQGRLWYSVPVLTAGRAHGVLYRGFVSEWHHPESSTLAYRVEEVP
jgi:hypothetical protein